MDIIGESLVIKLRGARRGRRPKKIDIRKFNNGNGGKEHIQSLIDTSAIYEPVKIKEELPTVPLYDWIKLNHPESFEKMLELFDSEEEMLMWVYKKENLARDERIWEREFFHIECKSCGMLTPNEEDRCPCGYVKDLDKFSRNTFQGSHE
tara:strand:- start:58 stop:507 length:450 start_codon:yes stop_codon:yes gene_type:complete